MSATFEAELTQFLMPHGRQKTVTTSLPVEVKPIYEDLRQRGLNLHAEMLSNGVVSITVSNDEEDLDFSITPNGPQVQSGIVEMLKRQKWTKTKPTE